MTKTRIPASRRPHIPAPGATIIFVSRPTRLKNKTSGTRRWLFYVGHEGEDEARGAVVYFHPPKRFWKWTWSANNEVRPAHMDLLGKTSLPLPSSGKLSVEYFKEHIPEGQFAEAVAAAIVLT